MKQPKLKEPVRLRMRALKNGNTSLYLDAYRNGVRSYEFLNLYLIPERCPADRQRNAETLSIANTVKARRIVEIQTESNGLPTPTTGGRMPLADFMRQAQEEYERRGSYRYGNAIGCTIRHIERFAGTRMQLKGVDARFVKAFIDYLRTTARTHSGAPLRPSTQAAYLSVLRTQLHRAVRSGHIQRNPVSDLSPADKPEARCRPRAFLTLDEVRRLAATPCNNDEVKRAFLFGCFAGLRKSDIAALVWRNIRDVGDGTMCVETVQQKTHEAVWLPLSENAVEQLPPRGAADARVFHLPGWRVVGRELRRWSQAAGIDKQVTFHVSRHTCATLLLTFGADLYTVSKLLGHTNIQTTQIYAKIVDEKKRAAVELVPKI